MKIVKDIDYNYPTGDRETLGGKWYFVSFYSVPSKGFWIHEKSYILGKLVIAFENYNGFLKGKWVRPGYMIIIDNKDDNLRYYYAR